MKFFMPVMLAALFLVGCEKIEGQLNITKDLKLVNSRGVTHLLKVGTYSADLSAKTSKKIVLRLNNDSDEKFVFVHNGNIPDNGSFSISSKVSGQPVDLTGDVSTVVTNSETREGTQSCTYQIPEQVCYPTGPYGGMSCSMQYRTVNGLQWIRYYDRQTNKNVNLSVKPSSATVESADFHGNINYADRVVTSESGCR
ncbi:MAG: hypothetical protein H7281_02165 [Bacteriovorax sp.]|nr:hypothetical protein [Bacteriovorax sp.]